MELFIYIFAALFSVINPLGTLPIFVGLTQNDTSQERARISLWAAINTFIILLIAFFLGKYILGFFGITLNSLRIAGGLVITSSGFALLTGSFSKHKGIDKRVKDDAYQRNDIAAYTFSYTYACRTWFYFTINCLTRGISKKH